jgi:hypothetical protein
MRIAAHCAAIVTTALVVLPRASAAQSAPPPTEPAAAASEAVSLSYDESTPADCPSAEEFRAEVTKLTSKARFTSERGARPIRIDLDRRGNAIVGKLVTGEGKHQSSREVRGKDCREVSSALAIAVALTLDPDALMGGEEEPTPPEPVPEPQKPPPPPPPKPAPETKPPPPPPPAPKRVELLWGLGVGLSIENAWAPGLRPGGHVFVMLGVGDHVRVDLGTVYFPTREDDDVAFSAWFGRADVAWDVVTLGVLHPFISLGYEGGRVEAVGSGLATTVEATRPWHALNAGLGVRFETTDVFLQLGGYLMVPLSRQQYLVSDTEGNLTPFFETSSVGVRQETTLGLFL